MSAPIVVDWPAVDLVVFDVDGTLYDQHRLRRAMLTQLLWICLRTGDIETVLTLREFRKTRERLADNEDPEFLRRQYAVTAKKRRCSQQHVASLVDEWMIRRPMCSIYQYVYPGVRQFFSDLRRAGKRIAIFSDYPAAEKIAAMGLAADVIRCAEDRSIGRMKPDPAGLEDILASERVSRHRCLMIGDRLDRDAEAARRANVRVLIRSDRPLYGVETFAHFDTAPFSAVIG